MRSSAVLVLLLVAGCSCAPAVPAASAAGKTSSATGTAVQGPTAKVAVVKQTAPSSQYHAQDELGQYTYGYTSADGQAKAEIKGIDGSIAGKYSYIDANGKRVEVSYVADDKGFRASGDHLPNGVPELPAYLKQAYQDANARLAQAYTNNAAKSATSGATSAEAEAGGEPAVAAAASAPVAAAPSHSKPEAEAETGGGGGGGSGGEETSGEEGGQGEGGSESGEEEEGGEGGGEEEEASEGGEGGEGGKSESEKAAKPEAAPAAAPAPAPPAAPQQVQQHTGALYRLPQVSPYGGAQFAFVSSGTPGQYIRFQQIQGPAVYPTQQAPAPSVAPAPAPAVAQQQQQQQQYPMQVRFIAVPQHYQPPQAAHYAPVPSAPVGGAPVAAHSHTIPRMVLNPYYRQH